MCPSNRLDAAIGRSRLTRSPILSSLRLLRSNVSASRSNSRATSVCETTVKQTPLLARLSPIFSSEAIGVWIAKRRLPWADSAIEVTSPTASTIPVNIAGTIAQYQKQHRHLACTRAGVSAEFHRDLMHRIDFAETELLIGR